MPDLGWSAHTFYVLGGVFVLRISLNKRDTHKQRMLSQSKSMNQTINDLLLILCLK
jgi:hypothetical protein